MSRNGRKAAASTSDTARPILCRPEAAGLVTKVQEKVLQEADHKPIKQDRATSKESRQDSARPGHLFSAWRWGQHADARESPAITDVASSPALPATVHSNACIEPIPRTSVALLVACVWAGPCRQRHDAHTNKRAAFRQSWPRSLQRAALPVDQVAVALYDRMRMGLLTPTSAETARCKASCSRNV